MNLFCYDDFLNDAVYELDEKQHCMGNVWRGNHIIPTKL